MSFVRNGEALQMFFFFLVCVLQVNPILQVSNIFQYGQFCSRSEALGSIFVLHFTSLLQLQSSSLKRGADM